MTSAFLIQAGASAVAIAAMTALAAWARIARVLPPLDEARARALLAEDFPDRAVEQVWLAADGAGALARSGSAALVLVRLGDGYAARQLPWARALASVDPTGQASIQLGEVAAPRALFALADWSPQERAA